MKALMMTLLMALAFAFFGLQNTVQAAVIMPGDEDYLPFADVMPAPIGGIEGIIRSVAYPEMARKLRIEGKVFVLTYVNENGGVDDVKVVKGIGGGCDEAALAAVRNSRFTPGKSKGKNTKVKLSLSIVFKIR